MAIQAPMYSGFAFGGSQDYLMDNACGLNNTSTMCFVSQEQQMMQQQEQQMMQIVPPFLPKNNMYHQQTVAFPQTVYAHIENQRIEIDLFINSQNERLRMTLQEQRKQQISMFMKKYESKIQFLIKQKEEEIEKAAKRTMELQDFLKRMEMENQTWQRVAKENEAMVVSLNSTIERLRETSAADDAESCCCLEEEKIKIKNSEQKTRKMVCKCCNYRNSCVIMLPCRHLCSCRQCDAFLDSCPVCKMMKKASIEALV